MKKTAKVLSLILAMSILISSVGFAAQYPDVASNAPYVSAVSLLSALDIIKGYPDGTFGPDNNVTRAEFTVMLMRTMAYSGLASNDVSTLSFKDLDSVKDWAGGDIKTAYNHGIINGMDAQTFAPQDNVTYEQALKMIVCALGHEPAALDAVGGNKDLLWPGGYLAAAYNLKLNTGISVSEATPAKRWEIARMLFNSLEIELVEAQPMGDGTVMHIPTKRTFLKDNIKVYVSNGELRANETQSLESGRFPRVGEIIINDSISGQSELVYTNGISTEGLIGMAVKYYYKESADGERSLVHIEQTTRDSSILELNESQIENVTIPSGSGNFEITYREYKDDRNSKTISIPLNATISVNGTVVINPSVSTFLLDSGTMRLIDSGRNGSYDTVTIFSYETYVVERYTVSDATLTDKYRRTSSQAQTKVIDTNDSQTIVSIKDAKTDADLSVGAFTSWAVLSIRTGSTSSKNTIDIIVSKESMTGRVTSIDGEYVSIDGKEYEFSNYYNNYYLGNNNEGLRLNDSATYYLDKDGRIVAFDRQKQNANVKYGYISQALVNDSTDRLRLMLVTGTSGAKLTNCAERVTIDSKSVDDPYDLLGVLEAAVKDNPATTNVGGRVNDVSQLVLYTTNAAGEVSSIETVNGRTLKVSEDNNNKEWVYSSNTRTFTLNDSGKTSTFNVDSSTQVFIIPKDRTDNSAYSLRSSYSAANLKNDAKYRVEAYDVSTGIKTAKAIVVYGLEEEESKIDRATEAVIIRSISQEVNSDDDHVYKVEIFRQNGNTATVYADYGNQNIANCVVGDVIRYGVTSKGYITADPDNFQKLLSVTSTKIDPFDTNDTNEAIAPGFVYKRNNTEHGGSSSWIVIHGILKASNDSMIQIIPTGSRSKADIDAISTYEQLSISNSNTKFYVYDANETQANRLKQHESAPAALSDTYLVSNEGTEESAKNASEIFTYEVNASVRIVYIIKNR